MDLAAPAELSERRQAPRQSFVAPGWFFPQRGDGPYRITLKDASFNGVGFDCESPVEPGTRGTIRVEAGPMQIAWQLRIVFCGKVDGGDYRLGAAMVPAEPGSNISAGFDPADYAPMIAV